MWCDVWVMRWVRSHVQSLEPVRLSRHFNIRNIRELRNGDESTYEWYVWTQADCCAFHVQCLIAEKLSDCRKYIYSFYVPTYASQFQNWTIREAAEDERGVRVQMIGKIERLIFFQIWTSPHGGRAFKITSFFIHTQVNSFNTEPTRRRLSEKSHINYYKAVQCLSQATFTNAAARH